MPQLNPLVLKDKDGANHTFNPSDITGNVAALVESTGIPLGERRVTVSLSKTGNGRRKAVVKFSLPEVQDATVNGVTRPTLVRTAYVEMTFSFDESSNVDERLNAITFAGKALEPTQTMMMGVLKDLQALY